MLPDDLALARRLAIENGSATPDQKREARLDEVVQRAAPHSTWVWY